MADRLRLQTKILYTIDRVGVEAVNQSRAVWLVFFYAPPNDADREGLLRLAVVSLLLFAGKFIEAFDDTLIGWWSDRTQSRWGRRIPFILLATPFWALFGFLVFVPPEGLGAAGVALYFFITLQLYFLFGTLSSGPYNALLPELARSSRERVSVASLKIYFGMAGAVVGLVVSGLLVSQFGFGVMAAVTAGLALIMRYIGLAGIWNHVNRAQSPARLPLREALRTTFSTRPFLVMLLSTVLFLTSIGLLLGALPYYVSAVLESDDEGFWVAVLTGVAIASMALCLPVFIRLSRHWTKAKTFRLSMLWAALVFPIIFIPGLLPGISVTVQVLIAMAIVGAPIGGIYLFPATIVADICDFDALRTGLRREATFYGGEAFVEKTISSIAPVILAAILLLGNTADNPLGVRLVGPVAGLLVLAGSLSFRAYDLPDEIHTPSIAVGVALPATADDG